MVCSLSDPPWHYGYLPRFVDLCMEFPLYPGTCRARLIPFNLYLLDNPFSLTYPLFILSSLYIFFPKKSMELYHGDDMLSCFHGADKTSKNCQKVVFLPFYDPRRLQHCFCHF